MRERPDGAGLQRTGFLVAVFALGALLSSAICNAQYMRSDVLECKAVCANPPPPNAYCPDTCSNVPAGQSCTCSCSADNLSGTGECSSKCDYGNLGAVYCSGGL
jgi:hypothetical protein